MKNFTSFFCVYFSILSTVFGQIIPCSNYGTDGTNEPPGCLVCDEISGSTDNSNRFFISLLSNESGEIKFETKVTCSLPIMTMEAYLLNENLDLISDPILIPGDARPFSKVITGLKAKEYYSLWVQARHDSPCDFELQVKTDFGGIRETLDPIGEIFTLPEDLNGLCSGAEIDFSVPPVTGAEHYQWNFPEFMRPVDVDSNKIRLKIKKGRTGSGSITVAPFQGCRTSGESKPISVKSDGPVSGFEVKFKVCREQLPVHYQGLSFQSFAPRIKWTVNEKGCDSIVTYQPIEDNFVTDFRTLCIGNQSTYRFRNRIFPIPGIYEFPSADPLLCADKTHLTLVKSISNPPAVDCVVDSFLNIVSFNWNKITDAVGYYVILNQDTVSVQEHTGFFFFPEFSGQRADLVIQPFNLRGCHFEPGIASCFVPDFSDTEALLLKNRVSVFPNPGRGLFQIRSGLNIEKTVVFDLSGRKISADAGHEINLRNFEDGIYILKVFTEKGIATRRIIKMHK